jgi:N-acetylneuraminate synthase
MSELFNCHVGLSDHTFGIGIAVASIALGARIIEKHFTLDRSEGGVDAAFSMEPAEFKMLVDESCKVFSGLGTIRYGVFDDEINSLTYKRSVYIVEDMKTGDVFTDKNIRIIRPGLGIAPSFYDVVLGKHINCNVKKGTALTFNLIG